jgi:hypothetical protein
LYRVLEPRLEEWAQQAAQQGRQAAQVEAERAAALAQARHWGWDGEMASLPEVAARMRQGAAETRKRAKFADRGAFDEQRRASDTERWAGALERIAAGQTETEAATEASG